MRHGFAHGSLAAAGNFSQQAFKRLGAGSIWANQIILASDHKRSQIQVLQILVGPVGDLSQKRIWVDLARQTRDCSSGRLFRLLTFV